MSSSPPTERTRARWRDPAGWSLRTRLVAILIALLAVLGLAVGGTAEVYLRNTLYSQANVVELYISYLRKKIDTGRTPMIHTVRGAGYVLKPAA